MACARGLSGARQHDTQSGMPVAPALRWTTAAFLFLSAIVLHADGGPGFRRIRDSLSPNGAYVFAWGWGLDVVWSDDSRHALALYDEKYGESSVLWVDPAKRAAPGIGEQLKEMAGKHIIKAEKLPEDEELLSFWFSFGVILPDDVFVVDV